MVSEDLPYILELARLMRLAKQRKSDATRVDLLLIASPEQVAEVEEHFRSRQVIASDRPPERYTDLTLYGVRIIKSDLTPWRIDQDERRIV